MRPILELPPLDAFNSGAWLPCEVALTRGPVVLTGRAATSLRECTDVFLDEPDDARTELLELIGRDDEYERLCALVDGELL